MSAAVSTITVDDERPRPASAAAPGALLSRERERDLARRWRENSDVEALHELVVAHHRLVASMARKFRGYGFPVDDLIQEGMVGLLEAANRFEPERGLRFATLAMWWVRAFVLNYVLKNWSVVRVVTSSPRKSLFFNLQRLRSRAGGGVGGPMSAEERAAVAAALGTSVAAVEEVEGHLSGRDRSLNAPVGNDDDGTETELQDAISAPGPSPEQVVLERRAWQACRAWLDEALENLSERERMIIEERWMADERSTLADLGARLGLTSERVRQIENAALGKLRRLAGDGALGAMLPSY